MRHLGILSLIVCLATASGCNICCWGKRATELTGPTDIRKSHLWCLGEDAVFQQPMGPSREDYGMKATCWREWPAEGGRCKPGTCPGDSCAIGQGNNIATPQLVPAQVTPTPASGQQHLPASQPTADPFRDDLRTLPAPSSKTTPQQPGGGRILEQRLVGLGAPQFVGGAAGSRLPAATPLATLPGHAPKSILQTPQQPRAGAAHRQVPGSRPTLSPAEPAAAHASDTGTLKITVSPPIDTPAETAPSFTLMPPVEAVTPTLRPTVTTTTVTTVAGPRRLRQETKSYPVLPAITGVQAAASDDETLAGLDQMLDVAAPTAGEGPELIREAKPATDQFRLPTRRNFDSQRPTDAALEGETLSALGSMLSEVGEPTKQRR